LSGLCIWPACKAASAACAVMAITAGGNCSCNLWCRYSHKAVSSADQTQASLPTMLSKLDFRKRVVSNGAEDGMYRLSVSEHSLHPSVALWEVRAPRKRSGQLLLKVKVFTSGQCCKYESASSWALDCRLVSSKRRCNGKTAINSAGV